MMGMDSINPDLETEIAEAEKVAAYESTLAPTFSERWPTMHRAAFYGPIGRLCDVILPTTEADSVGLLMNAHVMLGSAVGRGPFVRAGAWQYTNMFAITVGKTSTGRKGTAVDAIRRALDRVAPEWVKASLTSGASTAEGLIARITDGSNTEPAVENKTVCFIESELAATLRRMAADGNTLGEVMRDAADSVTLRTTTRKSPQTASNPHVSFMGQITAEELVQVLGEKNKTNGFINRFGIGLVKRSKLLPDPVDPAQDAFAAVLSDLGRGLDFARRLGDFEIKRDEAAAELWRTHVYPALSVDLPGVLGAMTTRKAAHTLKLATIYALMDRSRVIRPAHLIAALAVVAYFVESVAIIFGEDIGGGLHDRILSHLEEHPAGRSRTQVSAALGRHVLRRDLSRAINDLQDAGKITVAKIMTGGRSAEFLRVKVDAKSALSPLGGLVETLSALHASSFDREGGEL